jgi:delta-1-pyrroline-5-carboxylate synthetase
METIIAHGMVPILNENDAVSGNKGYTEENVFSDNDALASLVAGQVRACCALGCLRTTKIGFF